MRALAFPPLTPNEERIIRLLAEGHRYEEIAARCGTTNGAVRMASFRIMKRAGCKNRTELVAQWLQRGRAQ